MTSKQWHRWYTRAPQISLSGLTTLRGGPAPGLLEDGYARNKIHGEVARKIAFHDHVDHAAHAADELPLMSRVSRVKSMTREK